MSGTWPTVPLLLFVFGLPGVAGAPVGSPAGLASWGHCSGILVPLAGGHFLPHLVLHQQETGGQLGNA